MGKAVADMTLEDVLCFLEAGPWSFSRFGDGEVRCMTGNGFQNCDGVEYTERAAAELWACLAQPGDYTYGLQGFAVRQGLVPHRIMSAVEWVEADVFHKASMKGRLRPFVEWLKTQKVGLVGPKRLEELDFLTTAGMVQIPEVDCYAHVDEMVDEAYKLALRADAVILCASFAANVVVHELHADAETCQTFIDCGSLWEPYVGHCNRRYHRELAPETISANLGE